MKYLLISLLLLLSFYSSLLSEKAWVAKHYIPYEQTPYFAKDNMDNCYAFASHRDTTKIYKSTDLGNSWEKHYKYLHELKDSVYKVNKCFLYENNFYISYSGEVLFDMSTDGGKTFLRKEFDSFIKTENEGILDINMYNDSIGVICTDNHLLITRDNWDTHKAVDLGEYYKVGQPSFFLDSENIAYISVEAFGNNFVKFNLVEETWEIMCEPDTTGGKYKKAMYDVCFVNDSIGFACGDREYGVGSFGYDIIWKTTNKGFKWDVIFDNKITSTFGPTELCFDSPSHGFAAGSWGKLLETTDGGDSWHYLEPDNRIKNTVMYAVFAINGYNIISIPSGILRYEEVSSAIEEAPEAFSIYPVPAPSGGALHIALGTQLAGTSDISIYDLRGTRISTLFTGELSAQDITVSLPALPSGPYFIAITTLEGVYRRKVVLQ